MHMALKARHLCSVFDPRLLSPYPDHLLPHLSKLQTVLFNKQHPAFGINSLILSVSHIHILVFHLLTTRAYTRCMQCHTIPFSPSITPSLFHFRLKTPLPQVFCTIDVSTHTHWTDLIDSRPDRFLLLIGFVLVFSSRLSAVD